MAHLKREIRIRAALDEVYALARDPRRWADWYVGTSDLLPLPANGRRNGLSQLAVGLRFPLTERTVEERVDGGGGRWWSRTDGATSCATLGTSCALVMLACDQEWAYRSEGRDTRIEVDLDLALSPSAPPRIADRPTIERLSARCVERSLANLKQLCEAGKRAA